MPRSMRSPCSARRPRMHVHRERNAPAVGSDRRRRTSTAISKPCPDGWVPADHAKHVARGERKAGAPSKSASPVQAPRCRLPFGGEAGRHRALPPVATKRAAIPDGFAIVVLWKEARKVGEIDGVTARRMVEIALRRGVGLGGSARTDAPLRSAFRPSHCDSMPVRRREPPTIWPFGSCAYIMTERSVAEGEAGLPIGKLRAVN